MTHRAGPGLFVFLSLSLLFSCQRKLPQSTKNFNNNSNSNTNLNPGNDPVQEVPGQIVINSPAANSYLSQSVQLEGTCIENWTMYFEGDLDSSLTQNCVDGNFSVNLLLSSGDGAKNLTIKLVSPSGIITEMSTVYNLDLTPPTIPGIPNDGTYKTDTSNTPAFSWLASIDDGVGFSHYEYQVGTSPGAGDLIPWTQISLNNVNEQSVSGIQDGQSYFVSVRAVDLLGNYSAISTSDGWIVDASSPAAVTNIVDGSFLNSLSQSPSISWSASSDSSSGINHYEYSVGTSPGQTNVLSWTSTTGTSISSVPLSGLSDAQTYYVNIRAVDNAGNVGDVVSSDGWTVDVTAPTVITNIIDGNFKNSLTQSPNISWSASTDSVSGINHYEYSVGSSSGATNILDWTITSSSNPGPLTLNGLLDSSTYILNVRAVDNAGNISSVASSDGWTVDVTAPSNIAQVLDGTYSSSLTQSPPISWSISSDLISGLNRYEYSVGSSAGATDVLNWSSTNSNSIATGILSLNLSNGQHYFVNVRAIDNAENVSAVTSSDSWLVDNLAPSAVATINDGTKFYSTIFSPSITWSTASDSESGVLRYEYSLGTNIGSTDVVSWTSNGNSTTLTLSTLNLTPGQTVYVNVRVVDNAENISSVTSSDGWIPYRNPKEVSSLVAWYKADSLNNNNNTAISVWPDDSGNNLNLNSNSVSRNPILVTNAIGGLPVLRFDGTNDFMINDALATAMKTATGASLFYVLKTNIQTGTRVFAALQNLGSANDVFHVGFSAAQFYVKTKISGTTVIKSTGTQNHSVNSVYSTVFDNAGDRVTLKQNLAVKINASYTTPASEVNFNNSGRFSIGQEWDSSNNSKPSDFLKADVAEIFIYKKAVNSTERLELENYLKAKYGL